MINDMGSALLIGSQAVVIATACALTVALIAAVTRRRVPWLSAVAVFLMLVGAALTAYFGTGQEPAGPLLYSAALFFLGWPLVAATYPDGKFVPRWSITAVIVALVVSIAYVVSGASITGQPWWPVFLATSTVLFLGLAVYRYVRRFTVAERSQVRWAVLATILELAAYQSLTFFAGGVAMGGPESVAAANIAGLPIPVGLAIGLLWPTLIDVDRALRVVVSVLLTGIPLALLFWGTRAAVEALSGTPDASAWIGAFVLAIAAIPLYRLASWIADRVVYRGGADPVTSLKELGTRLDAQLEPTSVPATIVGLVSDALSLEGVELTVDGLSPATAGTLGEIVEDFPVEYQGERLGTLRVSPRRAEASLTARDRSVLLELARYSAPALHGSRAYADLADARTRLVRSREEERKQLRRDLHDDLAPALVGISLGAAAVVELARDGSAELREVAHQLGADVQGALAQTREIAHGLRPPLLDDQGLVATIRQRLRAPASERPIVTVTAPERPLELPAAVELSALRIVQEAVSNVRRHASAEHCTVILTAGAEGLAIDVIDDGVGIPNPAVVGMGLASIRERAEELGGTASVTRGQVGGTTVRVMLPFEAVVS